MTDTANVLLKAIVLEPVTNSKKYYKNENEEVDAEWSPVNQISDWFYDIFTEKTKMVYDVVMYDL